MRQIKFRGFHECRNGKSKAFYKGKWHKGEWVYGDLIHNLYRNEKNPATEIATLFESYRVDDSLVGQYTGLTDRNGREIYEGDIVEYIGKRRQVVFENHHGCAYFGIVMSEIETWGFGPLDEAYCMEVVGNVHDNPELLQG